MGHDSSDKDGESRSVSKSYLKASIQRATEALIADQNQDGHWRYNGESFVFATTFHIMTLYYIGETPDLEISRRFGNYLRKNQLDSGGWGLIPQGRLHINNSVTSYFALKLMGDHPEEEHMQRARKAIVRHGGIEATNFSVRFYLALYGIVPWSCVPSIPVEVMLVPKWFPFTIYKVAYWARTALVPISVVQALKSSVNKQQQKLAVGLDELFSGDPASIQPIQRSPDQNVFWYYLFATADVLIKRITPYIPNCIREKAISAAVAFCTDRLNGLDGFGSISTSMQFVIIMLHTLGYAAEDHPNRLYARKALNKLVVTQTNEAYVSAALTPVWDTALALIALLETDDSRVLPAAEKGLRWLRPLRVQGFQGDWAYQRPDITASAWAFFYKNMHYPDPDDTAAVLTAMHRMCMITSSTIDQEAISTGRDWILGMQSRNGGWGSYDADNTYTYLDNIPFADHDSLLDPPTADVTSSISSFLIQSGLRPATSEPLQRAIKFILDNQEPNGSWYGRWGVSYLWGTRLALCALADAEIPANHPSVTRAVEWLISVQNEDGGWGESVESYTKPRRYRVAPSTPSQSSWALLGLMAYTSVRHPAITSGVEYLLRKQNLAGQWDEAEYTGVGHPGILYLKYHGYPKYFPIMALAQYLKNTKKKKLMVKDEAQE